MKIIYITLRPTIHDLPLWEEYKKLFPNDEITFLCTSNEKINDRYTPNIKMNDLLYYSSDFNDKKLKKLIDDSNYIFLKFSNDKRIENLIKNKNNIFKLSENIIRVNNRGIYYHLLRIKRFILLPIKRYELKGVDLKKTYFLCQSYNLINELRRLHVKKDKILTFGYFNYYNYESEENLKNRRNDIVSVTRSALFKNNDITYKLFKIIRKQKDYKLHIYGNVELNYFGKNIDNSNLIFHKIVENNILKEQIKKYDILCFPSKKGEGFGVAILEAMAAGCIVFAHKDCGATKFLINEKNGFPFSSNRMLKKQIKRYLDMSEEEVVEMRKNAINTIKEYWDPTVVAKRMHEFLLNLSNNQIEFYDKGPFSNPFK